MAIRYAFSIFTRNMELRQPKQMKAISCEQPGSFVNRIINVPPLRTGEVQIKIKQIGICGTDLHAYAGNQAFFSYPRILGHEIAAAVSQANGRAFSEGEKVVVIPYIHCGSCIACRSGKTNCCETLQVLGVHTDGAMQEFLAVPEGLLIPTPQLTWTEMAMVEPLSVAAHAVKRANVKKGDQVLVMGCGPIGLATMVFSKIAGATVTAMDLNLERLNVANSSFSADHILSPVQEGGTRSQNPAHKSKYQVVFDATGNKQAMESGPFYACHGGKYVLVGLYKDNLCFHHPSIHAKELSLLCSRNATKEDFLRVIQTLEDKQFPTEAYHTHTLNFEEISSRFDELMIPSNQVIKAMVRLS